MKLDAKTVAALKLDGKTDVIFFDDAMPGFGFRLRASGGEVRKSWVVQYRRAGASRRMLLGSAEVLTAEQARGAAKKALAQIALGGDPQKEKTTRRSADKFTLAAMVEEFLAAKDGTVRPRTFAELKRYLQGSYFKPLHNMPVDAIVRRDVAARVLAVTRECGATTAARTRGTLSELFTWGMGAGLVENNPVIGTVRPKTSPPRERVLSDQELAVIWKAAPDDDFGKIVKLLMATGQRRSEVGGCCWPEIDDEHGTWTIPAERTKNKREHTLPLASLAMDIIKSVPEVVGRSALFGERKGTGFTSWARPKRLLDARLGDQIKPWTLHDLRRTYATRSCDIGIEPFVVEQILNHQSGTRRGISGIGGTYNRSRYPRAVENAVAAWDRHLRALIEGRDEGNVIPIRSAGGDN
jgi:integrase